MKKPELNLDEVIFDEAAHGKNLEHLEMPLSSKVFILAGLAAALVFVAVVARIFDINVLRGDYYRARSEANVGKEIILPAARGIILDRFGEALVKNTGVLSVFIDVGELLRFGDSEKIKKAIGRLSDILALGDDDLTGQIFRADLEESGAVAIARSITTEEAIAISGLNLPFVKLVNDYVRQYVDGSAFAHVVGYTGPGDRGNEIVGKTGLEAYYDQALKGEDGIVEFYRNVSGDVVEEKIVKGPNPGEELQTTIDAGLQRYFYSRLRTGLRELGRNAGVGLAINPQNGEVLALISLPSFDGNLFVNRGRNEEKQRLLSDAAQPLFNRAISGTYNPGSTIKPLMALAALKEKIIVPEYQIFSAGFIEIPNPYDPEKPSRFLDWKPHGWVDLHSALARSSNIYFYSIGGGFGEIRGLGIQKIKEYLRNLSFGAKTGIDLPSENIGLLPDPNEKEKRAGDIWRIGDTYNVSIGQGDLSVTPIQLLNFIASIANGGKVYQPRAVKSASAPKVLVDYSSWQGEIREVQNGMEDAVNKYYGTASLLSGLPIKSAGKTGSAQVANNTRTNAFFIGYAPVENPQIAILVLVENSREGSLNAVPIARDVLEWYYYNRLVAKN